MSLTVVSSSPTTSKSKTHEQVIDECVKLIASCSANGEYINPCTADELSEKESSKGARLFAKYNSDNSLLGCLLMTDKDYCAEGLENKDFLMSEISRLEGIELPRESTKIFWISSVCTSPESRNTGCASRLFEYTEKMALFPPSDYTIIAEAVRSVNDVMLGFSRKKGYIEFDAPLTEEDFGVAPTLGSVPWMVLYKILRRPDDAR